MRRRFAAPVCEWPPLGLIDALDDFNGGPWLAIAEQHLESTQVVLPELALFFSEKPDDPLAAGRPGALGASEMVKDVLVKSSPMARISAGSVAPFRSSSMSPAK